MCSVKTQGKTMNSQKNVVNFGWVSTLLSFVICLLSCSNRAYANHLRGDNSNTEAIQPEETHRQLNWRYLPESKVFDDDRFYIHYDDKEVKQTKALGIGDAEDFLRSSDVCPKKGQSGFKRSYCPTPPDCNWSGKWGKAKLCITRVPFPWDHSKFYVLAMKCIPKWENCDKCVCGSIQGNKCEFDGSKWDDDRFTVNCDNPVRVTLSGYSYSPRKNS